MSNVAERRVLIPILRDVKAGKKPTFRQQSGAEWLLHRLQKPASKSKKAARARKKEKAATHRDSTALLREAVFQRANGKCEACRADFVRWGATMDHFDCGTGKSQRQSVGNCWALCGTPSIAGSCHFLRQRNLPSVAAWNHAFAAHCARYGYPFQAHIEHQEIPCPSP